MSGEGEGAKIVEDSGGGIVLPPEEPERLARAILELKKDPARCREMGKHGREVCVASLCLELDCRPLVGRIRLIIYGEAT